jgi:hypothetical protein
MKLFVYGEFGPMAMENSLLPTWQNDPAMEEVIPIERLLLPHSSDVKERGLRRFWPQWSVQIKAHNAAVRHTVESHHTGTSAMLVFKGMELFPSTLEAIKAQGVELFCYNPDHPFVYSGRGSGTDFMQQSLGLYRTYFTYHRGAKAELEAHGIPSELVPFGYEKAAIAEPLVVEEEEVLRGCFIGNPNPLRVRLFKQLEGRVPFDLYGKGWAKHIKGAKDIRVYGPVLHAEHWRTMAKYRFQLNAMAEHNIDSHNMRTFAAPAAGAILVAPRNADHERFFHDGKEIMLYADADHAVELCQKLLSMPFDEASAIRKAARQRSVSSGYAYAERAQHMLQHMVKAIK